MPLALFGGSGNYASALYIAAVKSNSLDKVESEILDFVGAMTKSPMFSQFTRDLSVPADTRKKAIEDISAQAKLSEITKNFLRMISSFFLLNLMHSTYLVFRLSAGAFHHLFSDIRIYKYSFLSCILFYFG